MEHYARLFRHLASTANPHTSLFRAFEQIENADENRTGPAAGLFDFAALRGMLFQIVNPIPA